MNVLTGARMQDLQGDLRWKFYGDISSLPLPGRSGSSRAKDTQWDAIVGVRGRATFGREHSWYVPYYLDYDLGDNAPIKSINFNGPALGVTFRF